MQLSVMQYVNLLRIAESELELAMVKNILLRLIHGTSGDMPILICTISNVVLIYVLKRNKIVCSIENILPLADLIKRCSDRSCLQLSAGSIFEPS